MAGQNVYDDPEFFAGYQEMRRSRSGINEAIEQPAVRSRLGPVHGCDVVDLGCGDGELCRHLARAGAATVLGVDPSARMLALALDRTSDPGVRYQQAFAEDLRLPAASVDLVVSSLALHYVAALPALLEAMAGWLRPAGRLVASMEHPIRTAAPGKHATPGAVVDDYALEGRRDTTWYVDGVVKYHRRIATIVNAVLDAGLYLQSLDEPTPSPDAVAARPDLARHVASPPILVIAARKPQEPAPTVP